MCNYDEINNEEIIGWCNYCKNSIIPKDTYVVRDGKKYHRYCFELIVTESELFDEK